MAKFRRNHQQSNPFGGLFIRVLAFAVILVLGILYISKLLKDIPLNSPGVDSIVISPDTRKFLPSSANEITHHKYFSLAYNEKHEQAEWVAYRLTEASLRIPNVERYGRYNADYNIKSRSAFYRDYSGSGYTRGHLAPAGDMAFDSVAMRESFYMSNISPQIRAFNNAIWKELEEQVRDWAFHNDEIYVVTGPVLKEISETIGKENRVSVPKYFYKVILDLKKPEQKAIAFVIPHQLETRPLQEFAVTIDSVENLTGIDFFPDLLSDGLENKLESKIYIKDWKFSEKRYQLRKTRWNYE